MTPQSESSTDMGRARELVSEAELWLGIAQQIDGGRHFYLCHAIDALRFVSPEVRARMRTRVRLHLGGNATLWGTVSDDSHGAPYVAYTSSLARELRVLAALFLGLEAEGDLDSAVSDQTREGRNG